MKIKVTCVAPETTFIEFGHNSAVVRMPNEVAIFLMRIGVTASNRQMTDRELLAALKAEAER